MAPEPLIKLVVAIAPAFTIGLYGRFDRSSKMIALNASPVGSTPTLVNT